MRHASLLYQQHRSTHWGAALLLRLVACLLPVFTAAWADTGSNPFNYADQTEGSYCQLGGSKRGCNPCGCGQRGSHGARGDVGPAGPAGPSFNTYAWAFNNMPQTMDGRLISFTAGNTSNNVVISTSGSQGPNTFTLLYGGDYQIIWFANTEIGDSVLYVNGGPMSPSLIAGPALAGGIAMTIQQFSAGDVFQIQSTRDNDQLHDFGNSATAMNAFIAIQRIN